MNTVMKYTLPFIGPRLFHIYQSGSSVPSSGKTYIPNSAENIADNVIKVYKFCYSFSVWTSPALVPFLYYRGYFTKDGVVSLANFLVTVGLLLPFAVFVRGMGRLFNNDYMNFVPVLMEAKKTKSADAMKRLQCYDFDFSSWPVDFAVPKSSANRNQVSGSSSRGSSVENLKLVPCQILGYIAAHTFGIRMMYPGKTALIQTLIETPLLQGRNKLAGQGGVRAKVQTARGNHIDTMFVSQKMRTGNSTEQNGDTLVICCEGNAGFYEIGCMATPLEAGYSVLGWNHPGFGGSTGIPFPDQEEDAIDAVMQYALNQLEFKPQEIAVYAWSIGGYTATWLASRYPDIKFLLLDATFDDVLPLAEPRMPEKLKGMVQLAIRKYINLRPVDFITMYDGPIMLVRRSKDEMITTDSSGDVHTNRINDLLFKLLQHRYPNLIDVTTIPVLRQYLASSAIEQNLFLSQSVDTALVETMLLSYIGEENPSSVQYPLNISVSDPEQRAAMVLFLASKYMKDFDSTHCIPLDKSMFVPPWLTPKQN